MVKFDRQNDENFVSLFHSGFTEIVGWAKIKGSGKIRLAVSEDPAILQPPLVFALVLSFVFLLLATTSKATGLNFVCLVIIRH